MEFACKIISHIATLSDSEEYTKEVNLIAYRKNEPKIDIRRWKKEKDEKKLLKGIALTYDEAITLMQALQNFFANEEK